MNRIILASGLSDAGLIRHVLAEEGCEPRPSVIGCYEDYSSGPLNTLDDLEVFARGRASFWRSLRLPAHCGTMLRELDEYAEAVGSADSVEIWVGTSVQHQMHLIVVLAMLERFSVSFDKIKLVQFRDPASFLFTEKLLKDRPDAVPIVGEAEGYLQLWRAISNTDFEAVPEIVKAVPNEVTRAAMEVMASVWVADADTGLDSRDQRLINALCKDWQRASYVVGMTMTDSQIDLTGDWVLFHKLHLLAQRGLVEIRGDVKEMRGCEARLLE